MSRFRFVCIVMKEIGAAMTEMRTERDSMGEIEVPADKLWGAQTQRSLAWVISNRCPQLAGRALGSKIPVHPNHAG